MTEKLISSNHIQKLGHDILEIRERALFNIISKLDHGFVYDNDLARSTEILSKLFDWFLLEPCTQQELVFALIKRILTSQSGQTLLRHRGTASFKKEIKQIRSYVEPKYHQKVDEVVEILNESQPQFIVPPLESDLPLSYRSGHSNLNNKCVETTATTMEGFIQEDASTHQLDGRSVRSGITELSEKVKSNLEPLKWQSLIEPDRHVLQSIETSLKRPPKPSDLLHSSEFFTNVLLTDFPAEVFIQRPNIVLIFLELLTNCVSTRITNSVLNCLLRLTKALQIRVNHYNEPCIFNSKHTVFSQCDSRSSTPNSSSRKTASGQSSDEEIMENTPLLKTRQISVPRFCYSTMKSVFQYLCLKPESVKHKRPTNQKGINIAVNVLDEVLKLINLVLKNDIWSDDKTNPIIQDVIQQLNEILIGYGVTLEHFRLESDCDDSNLSSRATQLCLLHNCANFLTTIVPLSQTGLILPRNLKNTLLNSLVDVTLAKLYPNVYQTLLEYVESFNIGNDTESMVKYRETNRICKSMTSAIRFIKEGSHLRAKEAILLAENALSSLEFHKDCNFVKRVVELCASKLAIYPYDEELILKFEFVILKLLNHNVEEIREETYKLCQKRVILTIGPKLNTFCSGAPGVQILFLLRANVLTEIASHGLTSENSQIQNFAEDILIHIIKCQILVTEDIWAKALEAIIVSLPILLCYSGTNSSLGRALLDIIDPDNAKKLGIPKTEIFKSTIHLLFGKDTSLREEAFSRLCFQLASQKESREMLPRLNNIYDKALPNVCQIQRISDINRNRNTRQFYQPSSLQQVLDLLESPNVEPVIRRSALTQISVMIEDPLLHVTFLSNRGLDAVLNVMKLALIERNYEVYPDSIIPAIGILKSMCLHHSGARQELSTNRELYYNVLRGLFMFFTEERLRQDAVSLLFMLVFHDYIIGTPSKADFSIPYIVSSKLHVPFSCEHHWEVSKYYEESRMGLLTKDRWCLSSLQIQWNLEIFGFEELLTWSKPQSHNIAEGLKLRDYDLLSLKASSIQSCVKQNLVDIQNGTTHNAVMNSIYKLSRYVYLYKISKTDNHQFWTQPWEGTFTRFLKSLPSEEEDAKLLTTVLQFLKLLASLHHSSDGPFWVSNFLKNPSNYILDFIKVETSASEDLKQVSQELLTVITTCALQEQHFLDYLFVNKPKVEVSSWEKVIEIIGDNLKFGDATHFYNLAYLDSLLSCLVHLTATLGWSNSRPGSAPKKLLPQMVSSLCELVVVFHCGKGPIAAVSVMGLNITRCVILILNHLVAEMQSSKVKNWELCFMEVDEQEWMKSFLVLWTSRDVLLRAGVLQLFAGLATSARLAINIVNELKNENEGVWKMALNLLSDHEEASVVRENSALLLANLCSHTSHNSGASTIIKSLVPQIRKEDNNDPVAAILRMLENDQFYTHIITILNYLYTTRIITYDYQFNKNFSDRQRLVDMSSNSSSSTNINWTTTPSLVKSVSLLMLHLHNLSPNVISGKLQEYGIAKMLFRCICNPTMSICDTRKLSLYCEILEMDIAIVRLLNQVSRGNKACLGTILHTKDCLNVMVSLLNVKNYHVHFAQLVCLRNRFWSEIFKLLITLMAYDNDSDLNYSQEALQIISETISDSGKLPFIETICESINSTGFHDLQNSALQSLTCLLGVESQCTTNKQSHCSMQDLLDSVRTPRSTINSTRTTSTNIESNRTRIVESALFDPLKENQELSLHTDNMAGAEICKILVNLYDLSVLDASKEITKKKPLVVSSLSAILSVSKEAKNYALKHKLMTTIMKEIRDFYIILSLESVDCLRRVLDKKRLCPLLKELGEIVGLITNFMVGEEEIKVKFSEMGLCDLIHKLWVWVMAQKELLVDVLKMIATLTADCPIACQSLTVTSSVAGSGPRKAPTKISLLHAIINIVEKEMEHVSKTHNLEPLELCFIILKHCCTSLECRVLFCKSTLLNGATRLHPAMTKRQKPWESVELLWLEFLHCYSLHPEGQSSIAKFKDVLELAIILTSSPRIANKTVALLVLRNIAFYQSNRSRLLTSSEFLNVLQVKLDSGSEDERAIVVLMMWSLAANNQKAKIVFKAAQLDFKLQRILKHYQLMDSVPKENLQRIEYVLSVLKNAEKGG